MTLTPFTTQWLPRIESTLKELITFPHSPQDTLFEAARYAALAGGKRLRPLLMLATTEALEGEPDHALIPACAIELIHTYSLIHDDLPCMDNDDFRRGQLTVHKKYSESTAVLTGDFLLNLAFEVLAEAPHLSSEERLKLISILGRRAGGQGMIGGQFLDIAAEKQTLLLSELQEIHRKKTAELLIASLEFGAVISRAAHLLQPLGHIGEQLGLAFQIMDDVLDVTASEEKHGRKVSSDQLKEKNTYVSLLGLEEATSSAQQLLGHVLSELQKLPIKGTLLREFATKLVQR